MEAKRKGLTVIAITSCATAKEVTSRHSSGKLLSDVADVVIDNQAPVGDASLPLPALGTSMSPVSTITGVFILNSIIAEAVARATQAGVKIDLYVSANAPVASTLPEDIAKKWSARIQGL